MLTESQLTRLLSKKYIEIKLSPHQKLELYKRLEELDMSPSEYFIYLSEEYEGNHLASLKHFRYNLKRRVKKGINLIYIEELIKLRDYLNLLIKKL